jgi:hypothetical protein
MKLIRAVIVAVVMILLSTQLVFAEDNFIKGHATVYSLNGKTAMGTPVRLGVCASGNRKLLGKLVIVYQRLPDETIGDVIGIYSVEDTGCKSNVIDIWCPKEYQKMIINKTWEKGCKGRIYIQVVDKPQQ